MKKSLCLLLLAASCFGTSAHVFAKDVTLSWDRNSETDVAGYKLYYKADSSTGTFDGSDAVQGKSPVDVKDLTTFTLNGLDPAKDYYFQVTAYDTAGDESAFSNMVESYGAVPATPPATPPATAPSGDANGDGTVNISDALLVLQAALNPALQTPAVLAAGDVWPLDANGKPKGDGVIDLNDARLILQRAVGLVSW
ncbi:fibronectin type III domain-containing protein [Geotalea sp. SG265]|uniref:dockerin type I repeat-containing protein n=1 Tax=Geotalea sp. SG265 TaxID=2922867 RepID=UPI001FAEB545|nr:fibronectin type III domain-containing protein [Geotalea sp. SG265]